VAVALVVLAVVEAWRSLAWKRNCRRRVTGGRRPTASARRRGRRAPRAKRQGARRPGPAADAARQGRLETV